jgi:NAD(P)-dependent dehydrogenase (short-subunit alcohol dehydrogenase family)
MKHELPALLASGRGAIVNVSSMDAQLRLAGTGSYAAAKAGVEALTVAAAREFAPQNVRINAVRPGPVRTPMLQANLDADPEGAERRYRQLIGVGRLGEPHEIAAAISWLCSDAASYITGQILSVDGLMSAGGHTENP